MPLGKVVLSGGAQVAGEGSANFRTGFQESGPVVVGPIVTGPTYLWRNGVRNHDSVAHTIAHLAVCANMPPGYAVKHEHVTVLQGNERAVAAFCTPDSGTLPYGGGLLLDPAVWPNTLDKHIRLYTAYAFVDKPRWVAGIAHESSETQSATGWAICAKV